jgi:ASC-1-like (ASCH) protein
LFGWQRGGNVYNFWYGAILVAVICKKSYNPYFEQVRNGEKRFDLRLADFEVNSGDTVIFEEYDEVTRQPTGRSTVHKVGYVLKTKEAAYWSAEDIARFGFVVMGLEECERMDKT